MNLDDDRPSATRVPADLQRKHLLVEALRIVDARRNYYGRLFWQMPSIIVGSAVIFMGFATTGGAPDWWALAIVGIVLLFVGRIGHALKNGQDQLEDQLDHIDDALAREIGDGALLKLPRGNKLGSRFAVVMMLYIMGAVALAGSGFILATEQGWLALVL